MNRRDLLKNASMLLASSLTPSLAAGQASRKSGVHSEKLSAANKPNASSGTGISVLFHGLWGFWVGAPDASSSTKGVLAFTPDAGHTLLAGLSNVGAAGTLAPGNYIVNVASTQSDPLAVLAAILAYPSGFFFDNRSTGDPVTVDTGHSWASIWLPLPDTIYPGYGVQVTPACEPFQGNDVVKYRIGTEYPTTQQFVYGSATKADLLYTGGGSPLLSTTPDQPELQFSTLPPYGPGSGFPHERDAFAKLIALLQRKSSAIDIKLTKPIGNCSPVGPVMKQADRAKLAKGSVFSVPPANCAGGDGCLVGP